MSRPDGLRFRPPDAVFFLALLFFCVLMLLTDNPPADAGPRILRNLAVGLVLLGALFLDGTASGRAAKFWIRLITAQMMFAFIFPLVTPFQLILDKTWNDPAVLAFEQAAFGVQPTVWVQKFLSPALTEWLMFSYVAYLPLYPIICAVLYFKRGERAMEDYIFALAVANFACVVCFILFPVAGPLYWIADQYTVPLKGSVFTAAGEIIRTRFQEIGSSIPSPHCANATIMALTAFRFHRPTFFVISPIIVSIYVSAFACRFHYLSDVVLGIAVGAATIAAVPGVLRAWNARAEGSALPPGARERAQ